MINSYWIGFGFRIACFASTIFIIPRCGSGCCEWCWGKLGYRLLKGKKIYTDNSKDYNLVAALAPLSQQTLRSSRSLRKSASSGSPAGQTSVFTNWSDYSSGRLELRTGWEFVGPRWLWNWRAWRFDKAFWAAASWSLSLQIFLHFWDVRLCRRWS